MTVTLVTVAGLGTSRVEVAGDSMRPLLEPGDRLVVRRLRRPRRGDVVAVRDPRQPGRTLVKRVAHVQPGGLYLLGDNRAASTDSRTFGAVGPTAWVGVAVYRYAPAHRAGWLPR